MTILAPPVFLPLVGNHTHFWVFSLSYVVWERREELHSKTRAAVTIRTTAGVSALNCADYLVTKSSVGEET